MTFRTVSLSSYDSYTTEGDESVEEIGQEFKFRNERLARFPFAVMLKLAFAELDFADRWCWNNFGPSDGECQQFHSEYKACSFAERHSHQGTWLRYWFVKTDYDFGYCEWYFSTKADQNRFLAFIPEINWGENYPKN